MSKRRRRRRLIVGSVGSVLIALATFVAIVALPESRAPEPRKIPQPAATDTIRVITYNVHLLPWLADMIAAKRPDPIFRARTIAARLVDYDVIGLCEVFDKKRRRELLDSVQLHAKHEYSVLSDAKPGGYLTGSGLLLLSRFPIVAHHAITYADASSLLSHGLAADGSAAKGALHGRIRLGSGEGELLDCFLTHLESLSDTARESQLVTLSEFIGRHSDPLIPMLLMGDFNVSGDVANSDGSSSDFADSGLRAAPASHRALETPYGRLCSHLKVGTRTLIDVWPHLERGHGGTSVPNDPNIGKRIDYIFVCGADQGSPVVYEPMEIKVKGMDDLDMRHGSLSDHAAVEYSFRIRRR